MSEDIVTLWIGERLGRLERACLKSLMHHGHRLALYCYKPPSDVPAGIDLRDASAILPMDRVLRHRNGSVAPFSDWFRYELLRRGLGTWVDADVYAVAPIDQDRTYLFGYESSNSINNAILRIPADAPLLGDLLRPLERSTTPEWLPWRAYLGSRVRELLRGKADLSNYWGITGPTALTFLLRKHNLDERALPADVFYPAPWQDARWILDPAVKIEDRLSPRTLAVHLWNECIRTFKDMEAPPGSFMERLQREGA